MHLNQDTIIWIALGLAVFSSIISTYNLYTIHNGVDIRLKEINQEMLGEYYLDINETDFIGYYNWSNRT